MKRRAIIFVLVFIVTAALFTTVAFAATPLPDGYVGVYYKNYIASESDGVCWITDGDTPDGLSYGFDSGGHFLYGTPTLPGVWSFRVNTSDGGSTNYELRIHEPLYYCVGIDVMVLPLKTEYSVGESFDPTGISVRAKYENSLGYEKYGDITNEIYYLTPTFNKAGSVVITFYADLPDYDGSLTSFSTSITVTVVESKPKVDAPVFKTASLPDATVGKPYSFALQYAGTGVSFSEYWDSGSSSQLAAAGLGINQSGRISGTPKKPGKYAVVICAKNDGGTVYQKYTLNVRPAEEKDGLWVNGVAVSEKNRKDILGDGTASFDKDSGILTLSSALLDKLYVKDGVGYAIYSELDGLLISLEGENSIALSGGGKRTGIRAVGKKLTIEGGSLDISSPTGECFGIHADGDVVFDGASLTISVPGTAVSTEKGKVIYNSGTLKLTGTVNALFAGGGLEFYGKEVELHEGAAAPGERVDAVTSDGAAAASLQYLMITAAGDEEMHLGGMGAGKSDSEDESSHQSGVSDSNSSSDSGSEAGGETKTKTGPAKWQMIVWIAAGGVIVAGGAAAGITVGVTKGRNKKSQ